MLAVLAVNARLVPSNCGTTGLRHRYL